MGLVVLICFIAISDFLVPGLVPTGLSAVPRQPKGE